MPRFLLYVLLLAVFIPGTSALAHKVISGVYADGTLIEGEVGFSSGAMAKPGTLIEVFDPAGNKLGETVTEEEGLFSFTATQRVDHRFKANLGSGHAMDTTLPAADLPASLATGAGSLSADQPSVDSNPNATSSPVSNQALEALINHAVAHQIQPLRRELAAYKEKAKWHDVLGGIGYIFGLFGIAAWMHSRREQTS